MKLPRLSRRGRREGSQISLVHYTRTGKLQRRTVTTYPPAPTPVNCLDWMPTAFELLDMEMDRYLAGLARRRAEFAADRRDAA